MPDIALWSACDHRCVMCSNSFEYASTIRDYSFDSIKKRIDAYKDGNGFSMHRFPDVEWDWTITGGEPTLNPDYFKILSYLREQFPKSKLVQLTHGDNFADDDFSQKIATIENYHICVPLHGFNAETHEAIVRKKWAFQLLMRGILNILKHRKSGQSLEIRLIIQKMNIDYLDKMYYLIHKFFPTVDSISTIMMEFEWQAIDNLKNTHLSYTEVMKKNESVFLKWGEIFGERFRLYHFPLCVVKNKKLWPYMWRTLPAHEITFTKPCMDCKSWKYCMGIHEAYTEFNGNKEFSELEDISHSITPDSKNFRFHPIQSVM